MRRIEPASLPAKAGALCAFVFVSSWLGLTARFMIFEPTAAFAFFTGIWSASLLADLVFAGGSAGAAVLAYEVARRYTLAGSVALGLALHWTVYAFSFLNLPPIDGAHATGGGLGAIRHAFTFTGTWGFVGLAFASLAPAGAVRWLQRAQAVPERGIHPAPEARNP